MPLGQPPPRLCLLPRRRLHRLRLLLLKKPLSISRQRLRSLPPKTLRLIQALLMAQAKMAA